MQPIIRIIPRENMKIGWMLEVEFRARKKLLRPKKTPAKKDGNKRNFFGAD